MQPAPIQTAEPRFDLVTHKRDKHGKIVEVKPYRLHILDGQKAFERPVGSGNLWYEDGSAMGRLIEKKDEKTGKVISRSFDIGAEHIDYVAPLSADQQAAKDAVALKERNKALEAEIAALKAEQKAAQDKLAAEKVAVKK